MRFPKMGFMIVLIASIIGFGYASGSPHAPPEKANTAHIQKLASNITLQQPAVATVNDASAFVNDLPTAGHSELCVATKLSAHVTLSPVYLDTGRLYALKNPLKSIDTPLIRKDGKVDKTSMSATSPLRNWRC